MIGLLQLQTSRRRFVMNSLAAAAANAIGVPASASSRGVCTLAAQQEVGPFYIEKELLRSAIHEDERGVPLSLDLVVMDVRSCKPLRHAAVEIWQCNASGIYSGFTKSSLGAAPGTTSRGDLGPPGGGLCGPPPGGGPAAGNGGPGAMPGGMRPTDQLTFLRGVQLTTNEGAAHFDTIYPGFYSGRTNHIHFRVRVGGHPDRRIYAAGHVSHTGQVFFPEELSSAVMTLEPYLRRDTQRISLEEDRVFLTEEGRRMLARAEARERERLEAGIKAELLVGVDPFARPGTQAAGGPGGPPPPPPNCTAGETSAPTDDEGASPQTRRRG